MCHATGMVVVVAEHGAENRSFYFAKRGGGHMVEFAPLSYQVAYLCKLKESGLINADEYDKINDYLVRKYS